MNNYKEELSALLGSLLGPLVAWMERTEIPMIDLPDVVAVDAIARLADSAVEVVLLYSFDGNARLIGVDEVGRGNERSATYSIVEIARRAVTRKATTIAVVHNHPMTTASSRGASEADRDAARKINDAIAAIGISAAAHLVVDDSGYIDILRGHRTRWRAMLTSDHESNISGPCCPDCGAPISPIERRTMGR